MLRRLITSYALPVALISLVASRAAPADLTVGFGADVATFDPRYHSTRDGITCAPRIDDYTPAWKFEPGSAK